MRRQNPSSNFTYSEYRLEFDTGWAMFGTVGYAFDNHCHPQCPPQRHDGLYDHSAVRGLIESPDEAAVDLELIERQLLQVAQARVAGAKTVRILTGNPETRRDFTDVRDVARAYRLLATSAPASVYNVSLGRSISAGHQVQLATGVDVRAGRGLGDRDRDGGHSPAPGRHHAHGQGAHGQGGGHGGSPEGHLSRNRVAQRPTHTTSTNPQ